MTAPDTGMTRQGKKIIVGLIFIAWGIIGGLWSYFSDSASLDFIRMNDASENAIFHAVLWIAIGGGFIAYYTTGPGRSPHKRIDDNEDWLPQKRIDDNGDWQ
jgi:hypothetical protein